MLAAIMMKCFFRCTYLGSWSDHCFKHLLLLFYVLCAFGKLTDRKQFTDCKGLPLISLFSRAFLIIL